MNRRNIAIILAVLGIAAVFALGRGKKESGIVPVEIRPERGAIRSTVSSSAEILPRNRLEVRPPVQGRIEEILAKEGQKVKAGDVLAWMSSSERSVLLDAARGKGEKELEYWKEVYKPIPLIAHIDGEVIVSKTQPGQQISQTDPVVVLSDRLIARAQVDETDIGKIKPGQEAAISLDAYPDSPVNGVVEHIYYESKTVNNVTVYEVDIIPQDVPSFMRSGMNAQIEFIEEKKEDALLLPLEAIERDKEGAWVLLKIGDDRDPVRRKVTLVVSDEKNAEISSGLTEEDIVLSRSKRFSLPSQGKNQTSPFLPNRRRR